MTISAAKIKQLIERAEAGQITDSDLDAFFKDPGRWRKQLQSGVCFLAPQDAQNFWQGVWDELLGIGQVTVPIVPKLTEKQVRSLERFGFLLMYLPAITEDQYPKNFVKPAWDTYLMVSEIERKPLTGAWVAIETIGKPHHDDPAGYPKDRLMTAVKYQGRFGVSHSDLARNLLEAVAMVTGFPKKGTRFPTVEEWNLVGNLFNWLRERHLLKLPNLGTTRSWEWCGNASGREDRLVIGSTKGSWGSEGLAAVFKAWRESQVADTAFRVLVVL